MGIFAANKIMCVLTLRGHASESFVVLGYKIIEQNNSSPEYDRVIADTQRKHLYSVQTMCVA